MLAWWATGNGCPPATPRSLAVHASRWQRVLCSQLTPFHRDGDSDRLSERRVEVPRLTPPRRAVVRSQRNTDPEPSRS